MEECSKDSTGEKIGFLAEAGRILDALSLLSEGNKRLRADFEALSRTLVTKEQIGRHTSLLGEVNSCLKGLALENKRLKEELQKPDKQVSALNEEVRRLNADVEKIRAELKKPAEPRLIVKLSDIVSRINAQSKELEALRALVGGLSQDVLKLRLRSGKRRPKPFCD